MILNYLKLWNQENWIFYDLSLSKLFLQIEMIPVLRSALRACKYLIFFTEKFNFFFIVKLAKFLCLFFSFKQLLNLKIFLFKFFIFFFEFFIFFLNLFFFLLYKLFHIRSKNLLILFNNLWIMSNINLLLDHAIFNRAWYV